MCSLKMTRRACCHSGTPSVPSNGVDKHVIYGSASQSKKNETKKKKKKLSKSLSCLRDLWTAKQSNNLVQAALSRRNC